MHVRPEDMDELCAHLLVVYGTPSANAEICHKLTIDWMLESSDLPDDVSLVDCCQYAPSLHLPAQAAFVGRAGAPSLHLHGAE